MRTVLLLLLILAGCYNPDLSMVHYTCTTDNPLCPDGQTCIQGYCGGPPSTQDLAAAADMPAPPDLPGPSGYDPAKPASTVPGCRTPGWVLGPTMSACEQGGYAYLPGPCDPVAGWTLCTTTQISPASCASVPWGFFGSRAHGLTANPPSSSNTISNTWLGGSATDTRWVLGCGTSRAQTTYDVSAGFSRALPCFSHPAQPPWAWACPEQMPVTDLDIEQVSNQDPTHRDGTLCCR